MLVLVARAARPRRVLETPRAMAFLARDNGMASDQRKSRDVMIERRDAAPGVFAMAHLAANAELTLVPVILAMARHTRGRQLVAIEIASVAPIASDLRVRGP